MNFPLDPIVLDLEIVRAIPDRKAPVIPGIDYCQGWTDFANMGISVVCLADLASGDTRVICEDNSPVLFSLLLQPRFLWVTFNGLAFDNQVLMATWGISMPPRHYDILHEIWLALGLDAEYNFKTHNGYSLSAMAKANNLGEKDMSGAMAPIRWQQNRIGKVIDYCLQDVALTGQLFCLIIQRGFLFCPKTGVKIQMRNPFQEFVEKTSPEEAVERASGKVVNFPLSTKH